MTEEQKKARKLSAESGHIKWVKDHCLRTYQNGEDYVFISYKSDDYERALDDILYQTCRKYGLRVYFDVAFDDGADSWINQFYDNMCNSHCKAMVAFISNKYYSSYATLLEMMARKTCAAGGDYEFDTLYFVPINLEPIMAFQSDGNTGLGTARFRDGRENHQAAKELQQFNMIFEELLEEDSKLKSIYRRCKDDTLYEEAAPGFREKGKPYLNVTQCRKLMKRVLPESNENDGSNKEFAEVIHDKLLNAGLGSVFIPDWPEQPPVPGPHPGSVPPPPPVEQVISLPAFLRKYNIKTFRKNTFQKFRLVGSGNCEKYGTEFFDSAYPLVWSFVQKVLKERGEAYVTQVIAQNAGKKNPPFITGQEHRERIERGDSVKYRQLDVPGLEGYSMCTFYGQYAWINDVLRRRIMDLGLSLEDFSLEYIPGKELPPEQGVSGIGKTTGAKEDEGPAGTGETAETEPAGPDTASGGITGPVDLGGQEAKQRKHTLAEGGYTFTIYGQRYEHSSLKNMMLTVFKSVLDRHPDMLDALVEQLRCLGWGSLIRLDAVPTTFRAGDSYTVDGREVSVGTSLGQGQVLSYIGRLMRMCGEPKENLIIDGYEY